MNDARNKLRSMGGIMASSPELMQAATQRFQDGGLAMTTPPMGPMRPAMQYNDIMRPQMEPPVVGLGRVAPVRPAGLPESPVFRGGRGPVLGADRDEEDVVAELMAQSSAVADEPFVDPTQAMQSRWDEAISGYPQKEPSGFVTFVRETVTPKREAKRRRETAEAQRDEDTESREANLPGTTVLEAPVDLGGLVPKRAQEDPAEAEKIAQDAMDVLLKTQQPPGGGGGEEDPAKSLEDYYKDARALISKVYGEEDDGVDNRMMDLAMIGLAIAAGQSPNALSNIAQGLLVGTQGMAQRREAERERERGLRTLALETAIAQQGAGAEAEAEAARLEADLQNKLDVARIRAAGDAAGGSGFNKDDTVADVFNAAFNTASGAGLNPEQANKLAAERARSHLELIRPSISEERYAAELASLERATGISSGALSPQQQATVAAAKKAIQSGDTTKEKAQKALEGVGIDPSVLD